MLAQRHSYPNSEVRVLRRMGGVLLTLQALELSLFLRLLCRRCSLTGRRGIDDRGASP